MILRYFYSIVFVLFLFSSDVFSSGEIIGNGGGFLPSQVIREAYKIYDRFEKGDLTNIEELENLSTQEFFETIQTTRVTSVEGPIFDNQGLEVDARFVVNEEGVKLIEINRSVWLKYLTLEHEFSVLVFHEYLRALAINDDQYRVSKKLKKGTSSDSSLYFDLKKSFENGEKVNFEQVKGVYSGRCFSKHDLISISASALVIDATTLDSSTNKQYIVEGIPEVDKASADYFDQFSKNQTIDYISHLIFDFSTPYTFAGDLSTDYVGASSRLRLRKSKGTLISAYSSLRKQIIDFPWGSIQVEKDEVWTLCYYPKPKK